jgi:hypothetical protein
MVVKENPPKEQGIRSEWEDRVGWHRKEDIYNTQHDNEGPSDKTDENEDLKTQLADVDAEAKIQADKEGELRKLFADKMKENEALKARLAELESKNSWFDFSKITISDVIERSLGVIGLAAWIYRHAATPAMPATPETARKFFLTCLFFLRCIFCL